MRSVIRTVVISEAQRKEWEDLLAEARSLEAQASLKRSAASRLLKEIAQIKEGENIFLPAGLAIVVETSD